MTAKGPLTKWQARVRNDRRARDLYARRPDIDQILERRRLDQQLREVWA